MIDRCGIATMSTGHQEGYMVVMLFRVLLSVLVLIAGAMILSITYSIILLMSFFDKDDENGEEKDV